MLTACTSNSSASKKIAEEDLPERTHIRDINGIIYQTSDVSPADIARNTEERMASNAKTISPSTFETTTTSARIALLPCTGALGVQNQIALNQGQLG
jgi:proline racemase